METWKLNQQIKNFFKEPLHEMSRAFSYKDKRIDVCAWVENPMGMDNQYFKYYNCSTIPSATKVARIRLDKPEYVGGMHREQGRKKWILTNAEVDELLEILQSPSEENNKLTKWQDIIITYNKDNFNMKVDDILTDNFTNIQKDPKMPEYIQPLSINYPIPDYTQLKS